MRTLSTGDIYCVCLLRRRRWTSAGGGNFLVSSAISISVQFRETAEGNEPTEGQGGDDEDRLWGDADRPRGEEEEDPDGRVASDHIGEEDGERHQDKKPVKPSKG